MTTTTTETRDSAEFSPYDGFLHHNEFDAAAATGAKCEHCGSTMHYVGRGEYKANKRVYHAFLVCDTNSNHYFEF